MRPLLLLLLTLSHTSLAAQSCTGCDSILTGIIALPNAATAGQTWCLDGLWVNLQNVQPNSTLVLCTGGTVSTGNLNVSGQLVNYGMLQISGSANINGGGVLENFDVVHIAGNLNVNNELLNDGVINVSNTLTVNGGALVYTTGTGGPIGYGLFSVSAKLMVSGEVNSFGHCLVFDVSAQSTLNGGGQFIDSELCDGTNTNGKLFDVQNGLVTGSVGCNPQPYSCSTGAPLVFRPGQDRAPESDQDTTKPQPVFLKAYNLLGQPWQGAPVKISYYLDDGKLVFKKRFRAWGNFRGE